MNNWPIIDHSIFSPSGRISKRAEKVAKDRAAKELFPNGFPEPLGPSPETEEERDLRRAKYLKELAFRGMKPRAYMKEALRLEAKWS